MWAQWERHYALSFVGSSDRSVLQLAISTGSLGLFILEHLAFLEEFGQGLCIPLCRRALRVGDLGFLSRLYSSIPRMFGIRILYVRVSGVSHRMDKPRVLVCYVFGSIRRSSRVRFEV